MSRREQIERDLPDFLDLVTACVEGGLGIDGAIQETCRSLESPLSEEFNAALTSIANGTSPRDAYMSLAMRASVSDLTVFVGHLVQAETMGVSIGNTLRTMAEDVRHRRFAQARERAARLPTQMTFVNVFFIPALMMALFGFLATSKLLALVLLGVAVAIFPPLFKTPAAVKRRRSLEAQLADTLTSLASALRSGYSFVQAIDNVAPHTPAPLGDHLRQLSASMKSGVDAQTALDELTKATASRDVQLMTTALRVQQRVGSNLAEILSNLSSTVRERIHMRRELAALTSSARFTGIVLLALPLAIGALTLAVRMASVIVPGLAIFDNLFSSIVGPTIGAMMVAAAFALQWTSTIIIRKMVSSVEAGW